MNHNQLTKKIESMKGKSFEYAKQTHKVISYAMDDESFTIKTDKNSFKRKLDSATEFFKYWYDVVEQIEEPPAEERPLQKPAVVNTQVLQIIEKENSVSDSLVAILQDNIAKLQANPGYINQAKAINNNVNSIINVQKLKLEMVKQMRGK